MKAILVHCVMWVFKDEALGASKQENILKFKQGLEKLSDIIPQLKYMKVGVDFKHTNMSADLMLTAHFDSEEDLEIYKNHPEHLKVSQFCKQVRESRMVCDYWI